jgi:ketosteroid isomerase-like protein
MITFPSRSSWKNYEWSWNATLNWQQSTEQKAFSFYNESTSFRIYEMKTWIGFTVALLLCSCTTIQNRDQSSAVTAIHTANRHFEAAHLRGDAAAIAAQYAEDAQLLWEDRPIIQGRAAIEAEWRKDIGGPGRKATIRTLEIEEHGNWAYETSMFLVTAPDGKVIYDGKYICIWKREKGSWMIHRDIGNQNGRSR